MISQVISIEKKKYAVGLFWQPVAVGFVARNYARQLAKGVDRKLNLFTEYRAMVGLGAKRLGHHVTMPSAAAEVMEAFAEFSSFLAIFKVKELFWLVAVRNGIILEDRLFDNEDDARKEYVTRSVMPDWGSLFAPGAWGMPRAVERRLEDVVSGNVRAILRPISRFKTDLISFVLLLVFLFGAAYFFREPISQMFGSKPQIAAIDPALAAEYKKRIDENSKELDKRFDIKKEQPPAPLVMPYDSLPNPMDRAELCYQAMGFLMQPVTGWNQTIAECGTEYATVTFKRGFGNLGEFYNVATDLMPGAFVQEKSESEIFVTARLPRLDTFASMEEKDADTVVRNVTTSFQKINTPVETNISVDTLTNGVQTENVTVVEIGASSPLTPPAFMGIFSEFSGVFMTEVSWDAPSKIWNYEVIIYVK